MKVTISFIFSIQIGNFIGYISVLISTISTSGHVLFAANVNEFKSLAKQFVPDRLADHLVAIVSEASDTQKKHDYQTENVLKIGHDYKVLETNQKPLRTGQKSDDEQYVYYEENNKEEQDTERSFSQNTVSYDQIAGVAPNSKEDESQYEYDYEIETQPSVKMLRHAESTLARDVKASQEHVFEIEPPEVQLPNIKSKPLQVNLDQLVQKVKEKLLSDITKDPDLIKNIVAQEVSTIANSMVRTGSEQTVTYTDFYERELALNNNPEFGSNTIETTTHRTVATVPTTPGYLFKQINLAVKKNDKDSYEDYITPKKEENIFYSDEHETTKKVNLNYKAKKFSPEPGKKYLTTRNTPRAMVSAIEYDEDNDTTTEPGAYKARTETMKNVDYDARPLLNPNINPNARPDDGLPRKVKLGTMIPTRETFKITSPNYYGKLPTVAEKYNFDEPIPEKDREDEVLKPIGPPPSIINGKKIGGR